MERTKNYSESEEVREPLSDVQFLYGKIEQLVKENEELKDKIRARDEEIVKRKTENYNTEKRCDYAYAFCYELQHELSDIKSVMKRPKKEIQEVIDKRQGDWEYLIRQYMDEFTKPYNLRKKEIIL